MSRSMTTDRSKWRDISLCSSSEYMFVCIKYMFVFMFVSYWRIQQEKWEEGTREAPKRLRFSFRWKAVVFHLFSCQDDDGDDDDDDGMMMMIGSRLPFVPLSTRIQSLTDPIQLPPLCRMFPSCLKTPSSHPPPLELTPSGRPGWFLMVIINLYFIFSYNFRWTIIAVVRQVPWLQKRAGQPN